MGLRILADGIDAFVHEGITTGLKGGRLLLDDEDLDTIHDSIHNRAVVLSTSSLQTSVKFATAPINLALACRLINRALTGPSARRSKVVNGNWVKEAWEALERSWEEFEALKYAPEATTVYSTMDDVIRFADGWVSSTRIFGECGIQELILTENLPVRGSECHTENS